MRDTREDDLTGKLRHRYGLLNVDVLNLQLPLRRRKPNRVVVWAQKLARYALWQAETLLTGLYLMPRNPPVLLEAIHLSSKDERLGVWTQRRDVYGPSLWRVDGTLIVDAIEIEHPGSVSVEAAVEETNGEVTVRNLDKVDIRGCVTGSWFHATSNTKTMPAGDGCAKSTHADLSRLSLCVDESVQSLIIFRTLSRPLGFWYLERFEDSVELFISDVVDVVLGSVAKVVVDVLFELITHDLWRVPRTTGVGMRSVEMGNTGSARAHLNAMRC